jgi:hypothetical protein
MNGTANGLSIYCRKLLNLSKRRAAAINLILEKFTKTGFALVPK